MPSIPRVLHQGLAADKPAADATLNQGWLYYETDTGQLQQSWNGAWVTVSMGGGVSAYAKLDEVIVGAGGAASIDFTGISGAYRELQVRGVVRGTDPGLLVHGRLTFNGDAGAHYDSDLAYFFQGAQGDAGTIGANWFQLEDINGDGSPANIFSLVEIHLPDYSSTAIYKNVNAHHAVESASAVGNIGMEWTTGHWNQTAAITQVTLAPNVGNWAEHSRLSLYGLN